MQSKNAPELLSALRYGFGRQMWLLVLVVVLFLASSLYVQPWLGGQSESDWYKGWDVVFSLGTLAVAVLVWMAEMRQEWEEQLPKRLNALFYYQEQLVMCCLNAPLASEGDIRAWAQQLGAQMADTKFLGLQPIFSVKSSIHRGNVETVRKYVIKMNLSEFPLEIQRKIDSSKDISEPIVLMDAESKDLEPRVLSRLKLHNIE